jgi:hypothetical protein
MSLPRICSSAGFPCCLWGPGTSSILQALVWSSACATHHLNTLRGHSTKCRRRLSERTQSPPVLDDEVNVLGALLPPPSQIRTRVTAPSRRRARTMERVAAARGSRVRKLASSSSSSDADDGSLGEFKAGGTCSYYAPNSENGCSMPRQCFDCLNFQVATETAVRSQHILSVALLRGPCDE